MHNGKTVNSLVLWGQSLACNDLLKKIFSSSYMKTPIFAALSANSLQMIGEHLTLERNIRPANSLTYFLTPKSFLFVAYALISCNVSIHLTTK